MSPAQKLDLVSWHADDATELSGCVMFYLPFQRFLGNDLFPCTCIYVMLDGVSIIMHN